MTITPVYFGLGSNQENELGSPLWHMQQAVTELQKLGTTKVSSLYKSLPMGPSDQPDFLNAVVEVMMDATATEKYPPSKLLKFTQNIETAGQRQKKRHWGERSIDVDILVYGDEQLETKELTIPHVGILQRNFVAVPLLEIAPDIVIHEQKLAKIKIANDMTGLELVQPNWLEIANL